MDRHYVTLACIKCGGKSRKPDDVKEFICGMCAQKMVMLHELQEKERLEKYTSEECKKKRKEEGLTQKDLAFMLNVSIERVRAFEQERELPCKEIVEWLDS